MIRDTDLHKDITDPLHLEKFKSEAHYKGVKNAKNREVYTWGSEIHE